MASFDTMGLDALMIDLDEIGDIPDEVIDEMLEAGGEIIANAHREALRSLGLVKTGKLRDSVTVYHKMANLNGGRGIDTKYVLVYPEGEHHTYRKKSGTYTKRGFAKANKSRRRHSYQKTTNQDVAFIHEFGGHGNAPKQWMRETNEKHAGEAVEAEDAVFRKWQASHNL